MNVINKDEIRNKFMFANLSIGDCFTFPPSSPYINDMIIYMRIGLSRQDTENYKAIDLETGVLFDVDPSAVVLKVVQPIIIYSGARNKEDNDEEIEEEQEKDINRSVYDWERITNKSKKLEEEGLKEAKEKLEEGLNIIQYEYGPDYIEDICKDDRKTH